MEIAVSRLNGLALTQDTSAENTLTFDRAGRNGEPTAKSLDKTRFDAAVNAERVGRRRDHLNRAHESHRIARRSATLFDNALYVETEAGLKGEIDQRRERLAFSVVAALRHDPILVITPKRLKQLRLFRLARAPAQHQRQSDSDYPAHAQLPFPCVAVYAGNA